MKEHLRDQFAFRPTGSTTVALIAIFQHTYSTSTNMLHCQPWTVHVRFIFLYGPALHSSLKALNS